MNSKNKIYLFCQYFPFLGGEQFLFNEVEYYPIDSKVMVFIDHKNEGEKALLSGNFEIINENYLSKSSVSQIFKNYWSLIFEIFIYEIITSPHRFKYLQNFKTHLLLLVGYLQKAEIIEKYLPESNDGVILYSYWFDEWATILNLVKGISRKKIKVICRVHAYDFDEAQVVSGYHPFRSFNLKGIDKVYSISFFGKKYIEKRYRHKKIEVEKLGVSDKGINPLIMDEAVTIVSCSSLITLKRVDLIIKLLKETKQKVTWVHFGNGPLEQAILEEAKSLPQNITFDYKGFVKNEEIMEFYKSNTVNLFINTSELEGIPVSMMEAISFGIPIIGCNICGVPEIVNSKTGLLIEKDFDIKDTAFRIEEFMHSKCRDKDYRNGVKFFWDQNYNADKIYPQFIKNHLLTK